MTRPVAIPPNAAYHSTMTGSRRVPKGRRRMSAGACFRRGGNTIAAVVTAAACCGPGCRTAARGEIDLADALEHLALGDSALALQELDHARYELPHDDRVLFHYARL